MVLDEFGFLGVGAQLAQTGLIPPNAAVSRHPGAAVLPARLKLSDGDNIHPLSAAVSPYIGLGYEPAPDVERGTSWSLALSELVCLDALRQTVTSVATRFWFPPRPANADDLIRAWALEIQSRFAADSPVAVVRLRELYTANTAARVTVRYRFLGTEAVTTSPSPARRAPALRARPAALRFPQGQYGGPVMPPGGLVPFELAPPQIDGVQPIRLDNRVAGTWPWGLSALRVSVRQLDAAQGVAGPPLPLDGAATKPTRLWWQSLYHHVQYAVPEVAGSRKILPSLFRARAISGLFPAWPDAPLPDPDTVRDVLKQTDDPEPAGGGTTPTPDAVWQPILPGGYTIVIAGRARAGALLPAPRAHSGSGFHHQPVGRIGIGSRHAHGCAPLPCVLLPRNQAAHTDVALQTWASAFDPTQTVGAGGSPADAAFLGLLSGPIGLDLVLTDPGAQSISGGAIPGNWDGSLRFHAVGHGSNPRDWFVGTPPAQLSDGTSTFSFGLVAGADPSNLVLAPDAATATAVASWLQAQTQGAPAVVTLSVGKDGSATDVHGFRQTLRFPLRVALDQGVHALPYRPFFFLFEDPEYNRRLASTSAQISTIVTIPDDPGAAKTTVSLTLAADRREYNSTGAIHYIFFFDPPRSTVAGAPIKGDIQFTRIDKTGAKTDLLLVPGLVVNTLPDPSLQDMLAVSKGLTLVPGDTLILSLTLELPGKPGVQLGVSIVADPVIPVPDAGYALLRGNPDGSVECVRFAFGPEPARVELLDPNDLRRQVVRRRAVFQWRDTPRIGRAMSYAIQKTTTSGSTHFPDFSSS